MQTTTKSRVLFFNSSENDKSDVDITLSQEMRVEITSAKLYPASFDIDTAAPDLVVINCDELGENERETINQLRAQEPELPIIIISNNLEPEQTRALLALKVQDWLVRPVENADLFASVNKSIRQSRVSSGRVHAVVSAVGGAGGTSTALAMADLAASKFKSKGRSVALFDLDFSSGDAGLYLNLTNDYNLSSVSTSPQRVDQEFIQFIQKRHERGFFLYSFRQPEMNTELNGYELVLRMLDAVSIEHQTVILDVPYYESEWTTDVLAAVDTCTIVTLATPPGIQHALDIAERVRATRKNDVPINIVFNQTRAGLFASRISKKKLKELLDDIPFVNFPENHGQFHEALERGILLTDVNNRMPYLKALQKFMKANKIAIGKGEEAS